MDPFPRPAAAEAYADLRRRLRGSVAAAAAPALPNVLQLQALWDAGTMGRLWQSSRYGQIEILHSGQWQRRNGADFLQAEMLMDGQRRRGDIVLMEKAQNWEESGRGEDPAYDNVVLLLLLQEPPPNCFLRNSRHRELPFLSLPQERIAEALGKAARLPQSAAGESEAAPLARLGEEPLLRLLQNAAAYRLESKRRLWERRAAIAGKSQALFEAWAACLGYQHNKAAMQMLAQRAPLAVLGEKAEAILFGCAGFLFHVLPERSSEEARLYHRHVWDAWWTLREDYALQGAYKIPWIQAPQRPLNHPQRRVAALAASARIWPELEALMSMEKSGLLLRRLTAMEHPYWSWHCSLPSAPLPKKAALAGEERSKDFVFNVICALETQDFAWRCYLGLRSRQIAGKLQRIARALFGEREDVAALLRFRYAQEALLQWESDFGCGEGEGQYPAAAESCVREGAAERA